MGKQRGKDRLYQTPAEQRARAVAAPRAPRRAAEPVALHLCQLTLRPHASPVCAPDGAIFDAAAIVPLTRRTGLHPLTGAPLRTSDLIPLRFACDPAPGGQFRCPVLYEPFTPSVKVVAIAVKGGASANVFSYDAVLRLNIRAKSMFDLLTGAPFKVSDIIVLHDPNPRAPPTAPLAQPSLPASGPTPAPQSAMMPLSSAAKSQLLKKRSAPAGQDDQERAAPSGADSSAKRQRGLSSLYTTGAAAAGLTSTAHVPVTINEHRAMTGEEERKAIYKKIRKGRKGKGYVRVVTNVGMLNIELHCDKVPATCDNFLTLAERKFYDGLPWHRVIPKFIAQTGNPTRAGVANDSAWGGGIKDEIRASLSHSEPGIVSMCGNRGTTLCQWFVCFGAATHLDGTHTVMGKVVGGMFVLSMMENEAELGHQLFVERVDVLVNPIRHLREELAREQSTSHGFESSRIAPQSAPRLETGEPHPRAADGSRSLVSMPFPTPSVTGEQPVQAVGKYLDRGQSRAPPSLQGLVHSNENATNDIVRNDGLTNLANRPQSPPPRAGLHASAELPPPPQPH